MNLFLRYSVSALAILAGLVMGAPAQARTDCASNSNLAFVHHRLDGAIDQLQHDQRDYGGHRVDAINDLQNAREQLVEAERWAVNDDHENAPCRRAYGPGSAGGSNVNWGVRGDVGSDRDVRYVSSWIGGMIDQLQRDQRDYGGHRIAAINAMEAARGQLADAERYDRSH